MEQLILNFLSKSSELILQSRITDLFPPDTLTQPKKQKKPFQFQLKFPQLYNFDEKIPPMWSSSNHKLLVLEFFLKKKPVEEPYTFPPKKVEPGANTEGYLVEQWNFELSEPDDSKRKSTIDSSDTLYTKLAILLRSVSTLSQTLPLARTFLNDSTSSLHQHFTLDYSIKFSLKLLSDWHSIVTEESLLSCYTNEDLVIPGRAFSFKVNYTKHLKFLEKFIANNAKVMPEFIRQSSNDPFIDETGKRKRRFLSDDVENVGIPAPRTTTHRKSHNNIDVNNQKMFSFGKGGGDPSQRKISTPNRNSGSVGLAQWGSRNISEENHSLVDSIFGPDSPIETQVPPKFLHRSRPGSQDFSSKFPRKDSNNSNDSCEYEFHIVENEEEKFDFAHDYPMRRESPAMLIVNTDDLEFKGGHGFLGISKGGGGGSIMHKASLKVLKTSLEVESIFKREKDDVLADILKNVESMKETFYGDQEDIFGMMSKLPSVSTKKHMTETNVSIPMSDAIGTLRIDLPSDKKLNSLDEELDELEKFYKKLQN